jgi:undecaprenyl-diphosphatase
MRLFNVIILAIVQGFTELLPVSSSAHVVVTEKLMGLDPSAPEMTLLLVMLHTGTMVAVIVYFWTQWRKAFFENMEVFKRSALLLFLASAVTAVVGEALIKGIEKFGFHNEPKAEVEQLFSHLELIAPALAVGGIFILIAGLARGHSQTSSRMDGSTIETGQAGLIGAVQGLCLPFRGFSRSGATISTGMLAGMPKVLAEEFSFALAVILTPAADGRELLRLMKAEHLSGGSLASAAIPSLIGAFFAFLAGLLALKWLTGWLERGRWHWFGIYCLVAAGAVAYLHHVELHHSIAWFSR